jgi:glucokinase
MALCERILMMMESNGGYGSIRSVGVSCPSANFITGCMENSPNMPWKGIVPLGPMMRDRLGMAVAVANNGQVIALGEHAFGCARGMHNFIVITLGTGLGSCIFSNGLIHKGADGFAGEVGHTCLIRNGRTCGCGKKGCLETYTAARGIVMTAHEVMEESDVPSLMRSAESLSPKIISGFCNQGDELAIEVYRRTGYYLGLGLANYASLVNPEAIIFTGGIPKAGDWLMDPMKESFETHVYHNMKGNVKFLISELDEENHDVLGASVLAWEVKEYSLFK